MEIMAVRSSVTLCVIFGMAVIYKMLSVKLEFR